VQQSPWAEPSSTSIVAPAPRSVVEASRTSGASPRGGHDLRLHGHSPAPHRAPPHRGAAHDGRCTTTRV